MVATSIVSILNGELEVVDVLSGLLIDSTFLELY
jgi:hypothetical protein